ncbi:hypothetical protein [Evansella tamaricis]|uniref:DUF6199 domain-containing protein n=1 Tax=Evansella tamaricis TaxID=2069301 RepID=A0ABS6JKN1_9BACI|nr:hypothetical protein [Evansella tamaricis]MBU9714146.1 hypothetical protein [Evansella tamaricis]
MAEIILTILLSIPLYGLFIWSYLHPEESMLFGQRWRYQEEPEFSENAIRLSKYGSVIGIITLTIILIGVIVDHHLVILVMVLGLICYIIYGGYKILSQF